MAKTTLAGQYKPQLEYPSISWPRLHLLTHLLVSTTTRISLDIMAKTTLAGQYKPQLEYPRYHGQDYTCWSVQTTTRISLDIMTKTTLAGQYKPQLEYPSISWPRLHLLVSTNHN
ncbi:hypothetical protein J6590_024726 [Homalodisca vitripennis]|nr:hypothetical protein J6590_024726 [Homalodisca vitripennis]